MNRILLVSLLMLCFGAGCNQPEKNTELQKVSEAKVDKSGKAFIDFPDLCVINDSIACLHSHGSVLVVSDVNTGKTLKKIDFSKQVNHDLLIYTFKKIDTTTREWREAKTYGKENGLNNFLIENATRYNDHQMLVALEVSIPQVTFHDTIGELRTTRCSFFALINMSDYSIDSVVPTPLDFTLPMNQVFSPLAGMYRYRNMIYIGHMSFPDYTGNILAALDAQTFKMKETNVSILHHAFADTSGIPTLSTFTFVEKNGLCLVHNGADIYNVETRQRVLETTKYLPCIKRVRLFVPIDETLRKWYIFYTNNETLTAGGYYRHYRAFIDLDAQTQQQPVEVPFVGFGYANNKIITLTPNNKDYVFTVWHL